MLHFQSSHAHYLVTSRRAGSDAPLDSTIVVKAEQAEDVLISLAPSLVEVSIASPPGEFAETAVIRAATATTVQPPRESILMGEEASTNAEAPRLVLVPDTNVLLHCKPLDQVDLRALGEDTNAASVVFATPVIAELDNHKQNPRLKSRAEQALRLVEAALECGELRPGVACVHDPRDVPHAGLPAGADAAVVDTRIVHLARTLVDDGVVSQACVVKVLTNDTGMRLKCRSIGVGYATPPEAWKAAEPTPPEQKELRDTKAELERLRQARPKLVAEACVKGGEPSALFEIELPSISEIGDLDAIVREEEQRLLNELPAPPPRDFRLGVAAMHSLQLAP